MIEFFTCRACGWYYTKTELEYAYGCPFCHSHDGFDLDVCDGGECEGLHWGPCAGFDKFDFEEEA